MAETIFLDFVRYALNPEVNALPEMEGFDWQGMFMFAEEQAILGVVFEGVKKLGNQGIKPPFDILIQWIAVTEQIEGQNQKVNQTAKKLADKLKGDGYHYCILKGQGNALMYPQPLSRTPGDIDVWISDAKSKKENIRNVIRYVKKHHPEGRVIYHHTDFGELDGVEVEVHHRPSFMSNPIHNRRLQKWCSSHARDQFCHEVDWQDGMGKVCVPTKEFNIIFQLSHVYKHLLYEGVGLRQVIDYYYLLKSDGGIRSGDVEADLQYLGLKRIAGAMMWVLHEILGLEAQYLIAPTEERLGKVFLSEILRGGNFGAYNPDNIKAVTRIKKNWQRIVRDFRMILYFPSECLWEPAFRLYHWFWRLIYN